MKSRYRLSSRWQHEKNYIARQIARGHEIQLVLQIFYIPDADSILFLLLDFQMLWITDKIYKEVIINLFHLLMLQENPTGAAYIKAQGVKRETDAVIIKRGYMLTSTTCYTIFKGCLKIKKPQQPACQDAVHYEQAI